MSEFSFTEHSHRRLNPLTNTYVLCSPHRAKRPWQGAKELDSNESRPAYDPKCYLCPGNSRASSGLTNPNYPQTYVFRNDFPAVQMDQPAYKGAENDEDSSTQGTDDTVARLRRNLVTVEGVRGQCYVICFSPNHALTFPLMSEAEIGEVVSSWQDLYLECEAGARSDAESSSTLKYLQIFENKGAAMGCSNPHPHGQAWCLDYVPSEVDSELENMAKYTSKHGLHLMADYVALELAEKSRIVAQNDSFLIVVPFWAVWPFETLVVAKQHVASIKEFSQKQKEDLARAIRTITVKYDNLFSTLFPYSMGMHQAPLNATEDEKNAAWFHLHFYPPLLRSATVRKFLVGFEMLGEPQRDLTSEQAAERLAALDGETHYSKR